MKVLKFVKRNLKWITIISVMMIVSGLGIGKYFLLKEESASLELVPILEESEPEEIVEEEVAIIETVFVDIKGEVIKPGVYEIEKSKKVIDVIQLAGGFTEQADTSLINLARQVTNEMVIIIYSKEEVAKALESEEEIIKIVDKQCVCPEIKNDACLNSESSTATDDTGVTDTTLVNINTATLEELQTLSGIGESKAQAIIEYRETVGQFEKIEDLMEVPGIGEALYEKIKDYLTV